MPAPLREPTPRSPNPKQVGSVAACASGVPCQRHRPGRSGVRGCLQRDLDREGLQPERARLALQDVTSPCSLKTRSGTALPAPRVQLPARPAPLGSQTRVPRHVQQQRACLQKGN